MKNRVTAIRALVFFTLLTGVAYPLLVTSLAQTLFPRQANGSLVEKGGKVIGSALLAQEFKDERYFWPRPSAVGFNPLPSGGSNLSPRSQAAREKWEERAKIGFAGDMLFASASGLDPHVSPESAYRQVGRVAKARGMSEAEVRALVDEAVERRQLGFLGESRVNILMLNLRLDRRI